LVSRKWLVALRGWQPASLYQTRSTSRFYLDESEPQSVAQNTSITNEKRQIYAKSQLARNSGYKTFVLGHGAMLDLEGPSRSLAGTLGSETFVIFFYANNGESAQPKRIISSEQSNYLTRRNKMQFKNYSSWQGCVALQPAKDTEISRGGE
jgi:hypothetical protein